MTGKVGDVILLHPPGALIVHSGTRNGKRMPPITIDPLVALRASFHFDRKDESEYSLAELKTIRGIGAENLRSGRSQGRGRRSFRSG
jgi:hypothetical protein